MWEQISSNRRRTVFLAFLMAGLLITTGFAAAEVAAPGAGVIGVIFALGLWFVMTVITLTQGDNILLYLSGAREIERGDHPVLFNVVEEMTIASGLGTMPRIFIMDEEAPNAFAVGKNSDRGTVAVTSGLLKRLDRDQLQGVIAHEIAHIRNRDVLLMLMTGVMMGAIVIIADIASRAMFSTRSRSRTSSRGGGGEAQLVIALIGIVLIIVAPILAQLIYFAISRRREYLADACSAQYTRYPEGLAGALERISRCSIELSSASKATAPMYIANPMKVSSEGLSNLTSTHPPITERIRILRGMTGGDFTNYDESFRKVTGRPVGVIPFSALSQPSPAPKKKEPPKDVQTNLADAIVRTRSTTDLLWKLNGFLTIACDCGTKLKIPPGYPSEQVYCPHCMKTHRTVKPAA